jgi:hypothetical protein
VQLSRDDRKRFTWPVYATGLRARFECDAVVLVVTPATDVARWAAEPISLGAGSTFIALVLGPDAVPIVTDRARAEADPELAVLSVMAHGRGDVDRAVQVALAAGAGAARVSDRELSVLYFDIIDAALSEAARKAFQMLPQGYEFQSETLRKNVATTKAAAVVAFLEAREISLSDEQKERILACLDIKLLDQWIRRAAVIAAADELFE